MRRIGIIGLDTSHVVRFAALLHDAAHPFHIEGMQIAAAYRGGSPSLAVSVDRIDRFTEEIREKYRIPIVKTIEELPDDLDAIFLESVDGWQHPEQFAALARRGVPVFIDKPLGCSTPDAVRIASLAKQCDVPVMSCSAIRFAAALDRVLAEDQPIIGADVHGPMSFMDGIPRYFWYGLHMVDMAFRIMGPGCRRVRVAANDSHDLMVAEWPDGRLASVRGYRNGNAVFGGTIHRQDKPVSFAVSASDKPYYATLLERIRDFIMTGVSPVCLDETLEIVRFLEAADLSRASGEWVGINP